MNQGTSLVRLAKGRIYRGVVTGLNKAFEIDRAKRDELIAEDWRSIELIKSWLRGKDIRRWRSEGADMFIIFVNRGTDIELYPAIEEHLSQFKTLLEQRATSHLHPWYELQQPQEGIFHHFAYHKVVWPDIAREVRFALDTNGSYVNNKCYIMPTDSMWMLAVLNSELIEFLLCQITSSLRGGFLQLNHQYTTRLPVVTPDVTLQRRLTAIAQSGASGDPADNDE